MAKQLFLNSSDSAYPILEVKNTNTDAAASGIIKFVKDSATPSTSDVLGKLDFYGDDTEGNSTKYSSIFTTSTNVTDTEESSKIDFKILSRGNENIGLSIIGETNTSSTSTTVRAVNTNVGTFYVGSSNNKFSVVAASGNTTIGGTLDVTGATTLTNSSANTTSITVSANESSQTGLSLDVNGEGSFPLKVNSDVFTIATSGNTSIGGTLGVTGASTLSNTLRINTVNGSAFVVATDSAAGTTAFSVSSDSFTTTIKSKLKIESSVNTNNYTSFLFSGSNNFPYILPSDLPSTGDILQVTNNTNNYTLSWEASSSSLNDLSDAKSGGDSFTNSLIIGHQTTGNLASAFRNTAVGINAMDAITSGSDNVVIGYNSASSLTTGKDNVAIGSNALLTNIDGGRNTAVGYKSLETLEPSTAQTGHNTAVGYLSGNTVTTGLNNTFVGSKSGTNENNIVATGTLAGDGTPTNTVFILEDGKSTLDDAYNGNIIRFDENTTTTALQGKSGIIKDYTGSSRTVTLASTLDSAPATGDTYQILSQTVAHSGTLDAGGTNEANFTLENIPEISSTDDLYNDLFIKFTGGNNNTEVRQIFDYVGTTRTVTVTADFSNTPSSGDTYDLFSSNVTSGGNNTFIGFGSAGVGIADNQTSIGYSSSCTAANQITLGNSSVTALRCADTTISTLSDQRDKTNIINSVYGLNFINNLRPVQYTWNRRHISAGDSTSVLNGKTRVGFLAQELQSAMPNNENEILDLVYDVNPERLEAKYGNLIPILTKAVQELSAQNQALTDRITALENA